MNVQDLLNKVTVTTDTSDDPQVPQQPDRSAVYAAQSMDSQTPATNLLDMKGSLHPDLQSILQSALTCSPKSVTSHQTPVSHTTASTGTVQSQARASSSGTSSARGKGLLVKEDTLSLIRDMTHKAAVEDQDNDGDTKSEPRRRKTVKTLLTRLESLDAGPLFLLKQAMTGRWRIKVWIRGPVHVRSVCTGFLLLFDKHMNLVLSDVDELYRNPLLLNRREGRPSKTKKKKKKHRRPNLPVFTSEFTKHCPTDSNEHSSPHAGVGLCLAAMNVDGQHDMDGSDSPDEGGVEPDELHEEQTQEEGEWCESDRSSSGASRRDTSSKQMCSESQETGVAKSSKKSSHSSSSHKSKHSKEKYRVKSSVSHVETKHKHRRHTPESDRNKSSRSDDRSARDNSPHRRYTDDYGRHDDRRSSRTGSEDFSSNRPERSSSRHSDHGEYPEVLYASSDRHHRSRHRDYEHKRSSRSSHRDREYDLEKQRAREDYHPAYESRDYDRPISRPGGHSSHHSHHRKHSPDRDHAMREHSPHHSRVHEEYCKPRAMDLRDRLRTVHSDSREDERQSCSHTSDRRRRSVSQDDDHRLDSSYSPERREASSSSHHSSTSHQHSRDRPPPKSRDSHQESELEYWSGSKAEQRHVSRSADAHVSASEDPECDTGASSVFGIASSGDDHVTEKSANASHRKKTESRSSSRSSDLRQKLLRRSLRCSRQSPGRSQSPSETVGGDLSSQRFKYDMSGDDEGLGRQTHQGLSEHQPSSRQPGLETPGNVSDRTTGSVIGHKVADNREDVELLKGAKQKEPFQKILRRHVNQLFIRGDNVVMVAIADK